MLDERAFMNPEQPGRLDTDGIEWWATDPYPTWYRLEGREIVLRETGCHLSNPLVHQHTEGCEPICAPWKEAS